MSIKYLEHEQIDPEKWNTAVLSSETPLFYALFGYLDCVTENRWDALVFNEYEAVFPLPYKKKWGLKYLVQPVFCQQLGAFGSNKSVTTDAFLRAIPKGFLRVRLNLNGYFDEEPASPLQTKKNLFSTKAPKPNLILGLKKSPSYNKDCQKNLLRLSKIPVEYCVNGVSVEQAIDIYRSAWGDLNPKIGDFEYTILANAFKKHASNPEAAFVLSAHHQESNDTLGAAIFFVTPSSTASGLRCIHYVCAGPTEMGRAIGIMHGIINWVIQKYKGENVLLDFEGSSIPSVASFYKKFGATEFPYFVFQRGV